MNTQAMLDDLFAAGQDMAEQGRNYAQRAEDVVIEKAGLEDADRDTLRKGAVGGALAAGTLGLLLGTRTGRSIGGAALKIGTVAALGTLAYNAYKRHTGNDPLGEAVGNLTATDAEKRSEALLTALVAAAKVDGHIDDAEREAIETRMKGLGGAGEAVVRRALAAPSDPEAIAALADDEQAGREIYAVSAYAVNGDAPEERAYLDDLSAALGMGSGVGHAIEADMTASGIQPAPAGAA